PRGAQRGRSSIRSPGRCPLVGRRGVAGLGARARRSGETVTVRVAVRPGAYYDSVVLMQLQRALTSLPGVLDAGVVMATPANHEILAASGLSPGGDVEAGPHDLLIAVKAESDAAGAEALARVDSLLQVRRGGGEQEFRPRSLASA